ncbi:hypothetical protein D9615_009317 [Tricholomella constricta]|uniref:Uncharacterized protein n=1 Tax=Tricholomella constricta TaxID=117010 RepID=A0A8H5LWV8_9AGAR|nr:hypothetical protein D9615_009317 [Tricholomella constricta]
MVPPVPAVLQALEAASLLSEYTLTGRGTWLSSPAYITSQLSIFKAGSDNAKDPLLNPAHVLLGRGAGAGAGAEMEVGEAFMEWVVRGRRPGGHQGVREVWRGVVFAGISDQGRGNVC